MSFPSIVSDIEEEASYVREPDTPAEARSFDFGDTPDNELEVLFEGIETSDAALATQMYLDSSRQFRRFMTMHDADMSPAQHKSVTEWISFVDKVANLAVNADNVTEKEHAQLLLKTKLIPQMRRILGTSVRAKGAQGRDELRAQDNRQTLELIA